MTLPWITGWSPAPHLSNRLVREPTPLSDYEPAQTRQTTPIGDRLEGEPDSRSVSQDLSVLPHPVGRRSSGRGVVYLAVACALGMLVLGCWSSYHAEQRGDQYQLINLGQTVWNGGRMYVDCWENKPPGIAWLSALGIAVGGGHTVGAWVMPGLVLAMSLVVTGWAVGKSLGRTAACVTVVIASTVLTLRHYDGVSVNPDSYSAAFELAGLSLWIVAIGAGRARRVFGLGVAAGLCWAMAACVKQTGVFAPFSVGLVSVVVIAVWRERRIRWAGVLASSTFGFALGVGLVAWVLQMRGTLEPAWMAIVTFNFNQMSSDSLASLVRCLPRVQSKLEAVQLPIVLGLIGLIATLADRNARRVSRPVVWGLALLLVLQIGGAVLGPSRSMRYWQGTFPSILWLAALGTYRIEMAFGQLQRESRVTLSVLCVTLLVLLGGPLAEQQLHGLARSFGNYDKQVTQADRLAAMGTQLQDVVPEGEAIYVWAYDTGVYLFAERSSACRFTYPRSDEQMSEILTTLEAGTPFAILIPKRGPTEFDAWCDETCIARRATSMAQYKESEPIDRYRVWVRNTKLLP